MLRLFSLQKQNLKSYLFSVLGGNLVSAAKSVVCIYKEIEDIFNMLLGSLVVHSLQKNTEYLVKYHTPLMYRRYISLGFSETETFCVKGELCISCPNEDHGNTSVLNCPSLSLKRF